MRLLAFRILSRLFRPLMCYKQRMGYNCKHQIINGKKECGGYYYG